MILRRVIEHVKAQNWNADQNNKRAARDYVVRIQGEVAANRQDMATRTEYFSRVKSHALRALEALDQAPETLGEEFIIDSYFASLSLSRRIRRSTYDELLSASEINAHIDNALRNRMDEYYRTNEGAQDVFLTIPAYVETVRSVIPFAVQAELRSGNCAITYDINEEGLATAMLPDRCELNLTPEQTAMVVSQLLDADIGPSLTRALSDIHQKLLNFEYVSTRAQSLNDYIEDTK